MHGLAWVDDHDQLSPATTSHRPYLLGGLAEAPDCSTMLSSLPTRLEAENSLNDFSKL